MAATYRTSATGGSTTGTSNRTVAITPSVGDLLVVICAVAANSQSAPTCSDNNGSGTYDLIGGTAISYDDGGGTPIAHRLSVFVRTAKMANTTSTTITVATGSNTAGAVHVIAVSGMHRVGSSAVLQFSSQANQAASTTPAPAFTSACLTGNLTIGAVANNATGASMTAPTNWLERQDAGFTSDPVGLEVVTRDSGFTGTTVTWGSTSATKFASFILELDGSAVTANGTAASDTWSGSSTTTATTSTGGSAASDAWSASSTTTYVTLATSTPAADAWTAIDGVGAALLQTANGTAASVAWSAANGGELALASGTSAVDAWTASTASPSVATAGAAASASWSASDGSGVALASGAAAEIAWPAELATVAVASYGTADAQSWTAEDGDSLTRATGPSASSAPWAAFDAEVEISAHGEAITIGWAAQSVPGEGDADGTPADLTWFALAASVAISVVSGASSQAWEAFDATIEVHIAGTAAASFAWSANAAPNNPTSVVAGGVARLTWIARNAVGYSPHIFYENALPRGSITRIYE